MDFVKFSKKSQNNNGFIYFFENADLQDIIYTILTNDFTVNIDKLL